ncbi:unnamed protein product [Dibothriocephalus latus]|uniref:Uncharacterized protein n=1 Tax=Dibothriocephalus latus TaxID=60516 RepID=A0A3P7LQC3_DIBLA|nr:unnamed protein product [Dibothriocephalus latus]
MDDQLTKLNVLNRTSRRPSVSKICADRKQYATRAVTAAVYSFVDGSSHGTSVLLVLDMNNNSDSEDWSPPHSEEIHQISEEEYGPPTKRSTKPRVSRPPPPSVSLFPPTIISTANASLKDSQYGPRWSYPAADVKYSDKEYMIQLSLPTCDTTCQLILSFYRLYSDIRNRDSWNSCEKRNLQAVRHKYNVDVAVSDIFTSPMSTRMHKITIFSQAKDNAVTAVASLLHSLPTDLQGKSVVAIDHVFADTKSMRPPMFSFVSH